METLLANLSGKAHRATMGGREYLVAPATMIVPGVLNGSQGRLYYSPEEISKNVIAWNHIPLTLDHPKVNGQYVSARDPDILDKFGLGLVLKANVGEKLVSEAWFDIEKTRKLAPQIIHALEAGRPLGLSTGLFTDNVKVGKGSSYNGKPYDAIATNYRPDHLAILLDVPGACSLEDGCGVNVNEDGEDEGAQVGKPAAEVNK